VCSIPLNIFTHQDAMQGQTWGEEKELTGKRYEGSVKVVE